ncbi:MAG: topoisomerase DNA-binding C4 zinc finger domain-containing protein [Candidatus Saliniplasma sp.]
MSRDKREYKELVVHTDGACSGKNPGGLAAYGYLIERGGRTVREDYGILKEGDGATNNFAEYMAPIKALEWLKSSEERYEDVHKITVMSDSQLLVNQINGDWSVKSSNIVNLYEELKGLIKEFEKESLTVEFTHIMRAKNGRADGLAQTAIKDHRTLQKIKKKDKKKTCPECGSEMTIRDGKYGKFYGCNNYPECQHTEDYVE